MTTIQLTSATRAVLNDNGSEQVIIFDVQAKQGINVAKNGTPYLRLPKNSAGRSSVSLKVLENGEPYELTERHEYSQAPKTLDGTSDATKRKPKADQLNEYVTSLASYLTDDDQTTFLDLLTKAMTRKQARDTLDELKALYTQRQQETGNLLNQINELEEKLAD